MGGRGGIIACVLGAATLGACDDPMLLDLPEDAPSRVSVIIAIEADALELYALPLSTARVLSVAPHAGGHSLVTAILFDASLDALGLREGALPPSTAPAASPLPLELATSIHTGTVAGGSFSGWTRAGPGEISRRVLGFRFDAPARRRSEEPAACPAIGAPVAIPLIDAIAPSLERSASSSLGVIVALDDRRALVGTTGEKAFFEVDRIDRTAKYLDRISRRFGALTGFVAPGGAVYAAGAKLVRIEPDLQSFTLLARPPEIAPTEDIVAIDGSRDGSPFELFVLTELGTFFRFDGSTWELLVPEAPVRDPSDIRHRFRNVVWISPGHAVMARNAESIFRYREGSDPRVVEEGVAPGVSISSVTHVAGWGTLAGGEGGAVFLEDETHRWSRLFAIDAFSAPDILLPLERAVFVAGGAGFGGVALAGERTPCLIDQRGGPAFITRAARVGPDLLIGGSVSSADQFGSLRVLPIE